MAYSYYNYTGDGTTTQFPVAFGYIRREHVLATVAGAPATFTFVNSTTIQMDATPTNGAVVRVYRQTPLTAPLVNFTDGSTLVAADLDANALQSIYTQQELDDSLVDGLAGVIPNGDKGDITTSAGGSVWTIDTGAITETKVATEAITEDKVATEAITEDKVATGAITEDKVATGAITEDKVATEAITEDKVATGAVTTAKLASVIAPTVSSLNGGPLAGFRNVIINGNPTINQRGYVSGTATGGANQYTLDRWRVVTSGQNITFTDSANVRTVTAPAGGCEQVVEGASILSGTYTLNWTGTATATVGGSAVAKGGSVTLTGGTNVTVKFSSGTFTLVQLEPGPVATPFEQRPIGTELALCKRYAQWVPFSQQFVAAGNVTHETTLSWPEMRTIPNAAALTADPYTTSSNLNNAQNVIGRVTPYGGSAILVAVAAGSSYVIGYRSFLSAEL
jgi:hypothetical protein